MPIQSIHHFIRGFLIIIVGLLLLVMPGITIQIALMLIGAILLASGLTTMFLSNRSISVRGFFSLHGFFNVIIGLSFLFAPAAMLNIFVVFFGIILLMTGAVQLMGSLTFISWKSWSFVNLIFALFMLAGGFFLLFNPLRIIGITVPFSILLIFYGVSQITAVKSKRKTEYYHGSSVEDIPHEEV